MEAHEKPGADIIKGLNLSKCHGARGIPERNKPRKKI
jgi:hypothetical protein